MTKIILTTNDSYKLLVLFTGSKNQRNGNSVGSGTLCVWRREKVVDNRTLDNRDI